MEPKEVKKVVRESYGKVARRSSSSCCDKTQPEEASCCGEVREESSCCESQTNIDEINRAIGYTKEELDSIPEESILGLGCGNPTAIASLQEGETVVDLGSGGGLDVFLASTKIGPTGKAIGIDMTHDMIDLARDNAEKNNITNVEFRLGEIENLPIADNTADIIISNCVINLSPEKLKVFQEAYRVLKPGGRLSISDMVLLRPLPESVRKNKALLAGCIAGAELKSRYIGLIKEAGFQDIQIANEEGYLKEFEDYEVLKDISVEEFDNIEDEKEYIRDSVQSITVTAYKPKK
ncbi:MAG: arsenite methyltransferase [Candidatus Heimdallarchaeota archaeon]|nr:arsenite methyltransferase [Candidatus Heimdallarchaeota archaeon]MCK4876889.1 arsenite methyltransferase [Candidatus Heimdallarchaeota archaeon]